MRNFLGTALALVLGFLGAIVPIWLPGGFFAKSDGGMGRATDLTFLALSDTNAVEVDGVRFETIVPERVLNIPENRPGATIPVRIGLKITNNTSTPIRFSRHSFTPEFRGLSGESLFGGELQISLVFLQESDFPLVRPGESATLFWEGGFYWGENKLLLAVDDKRYSRSWSFGAFNPGIFRVRFTYSNAEAERWYRDQESMERRRLTGVLVGQFSTPLTEFSLVPP